MLATGLIILSAAVAALWAGGIIWAVYANSRQPRLHPVTGTERPSTTVSIIVPARNEAGRILEKSVGSMADQDYPALEVIAVNDRSTDGTGEILRRLSMSAPAGRLRVIDGCEPRPGWLGKPNALQQGFEVSEGDWILTTDADIVFEPFAVRSAVALGEEGSYDAVTLVPRLDLESFWERVFMPVFGWFCLLAMPLHRVNDPARSEALGVGNFFMVKRSVLEKIGGFEMIKSDVAEDLRLAEVLKKSGFRLRIETAPDLLRTRMYSGLSEIWLGFTKNLFSALKFSILKGVGSFFAIIAFGVLPVVLGATLLMLGETVPGALFMAAYLLQTTTFIIIQRAIEQNPFYAPLMPLGFLVYAFILLNSMVKILSGKGVTWKGRPIYEEGGIVPPKEV